MNKIITRSITVLGCLILTQGISFGQVRLPQIIKDSMVLQRDAKIKIWGWAAKDEKVTVNFNGKNIMQKRH